MCRDGVKVCVHLSLVEREGTILLSVLTSSGDVVWVQWSRDVCSGKIKVQYYLPSRLLFSIRRPISSVHHHPSSITVYVHVFYSVNN